MENFVKGDAAQSSVQVCNVAEIEKQLHQLWRDVAQHQSQSGTVVTRVCTLTLIAYGANQALAQRVKRTVPDIFGTHPARAVVIDAAGAPNQLSAYVSTVCQMTSTSDEQVCSEQITITAGEQRRTQLASTVLPLVVSDLPLFVWWPGPWHASSTVRKQLFAQADRWIIDSGDWTEPLKDLARMHRLLQAQPTTAVSDLMWDRLNPWRKILAQVFDQHALRPLLNQLTDVQIVCGKAFSGGLLGMNWLATMLDWRLQDVQQGAEQIQATYQSSTGAVTVELLYQSEQPLVQVVLASSRLPNTKVKVAYQAEGLVATIDHNSDQQVHVTELPNLDDGLLLNEALRIHQHDRVYESTMHTLAELAARLEGDRE